MSKRDTCLWLTLLAIVLPVAGRYFGAPFDSAEYTSLGVLVAGYLAHHHAGRRLAAPATPVS